MERTIVVTPTALEELIETANESDEALHYCEGYDIESEIVSDLRIVDGALVGTARRKDTGDDETVKFVAIG